MIVYYVNIRQTEGNWKWKTSVESEMT